MDDTVIQVIQNFKDIINNGQSLIDLLNENDSSFVYDFIQNMSHIVNMKTAKFFISEVLDGAQKNYEKKITENKYDEIEYFEPSSSKDVMMLSTAEFNVMTNVESFSFVNNDRAETFHLSNQSTNNIGNELHVQSQLHLEIHSSNVNKNICGLCKNSTQITFKRNIRDNLSMSKSPIRPVSSKVVTGFDKSPKDFKYFTPYNQNRFKKLTDDSNIIIEETKKEGSPLKFDYEYLKTTKDYPSIRDEILKEKEKIFLNKGFRDNYFKKMSKGNYDRYLMFNNVFRILQEEHNERTQLDLSSMTNEEKSFYFFSKFSPIKLKPKNPISTNKLDNLNINSTLKPIIKNEHQRSRKSSVHGTASNNTSILPKIN